MYIRTKDSVYEVEQSQLEDDEEVVNCDYGQIHKLEILRKSENLAELCDEIIVEYKDCKEKKTYLYNGTFEDLRKTHRYYYTYKFSPFFKYYGAIWVQGKGLIYVAKMNEKGELVLI